jgi:hypothetical protein
MPRPLFAQFSPDTTKSAAFNAASSIFYAKMQPEAHLYDGVEFLPYDNIIQGNAFYPDGSVHTGTVVYAGIRYGNVPLLYDILKDQVIVSTSANYLISPAQGRISGFSFDDHSFVHLQEDSAAQGFPGPGMYEVVYGGRERLLVRHRKVVQTDPSDQHKFYLEKTAYYLWRDGNYYAVGNQRSFLKALGGSGSDLKGFIRRSGLRFNADPPATMKAVLAYYDQINPRS